MSEKPKGITPPPFLAMMGIGLMWIVTIAAVGFGVVAGGAILMGEEDSKLPPKWLMMLIPIGSLLLATLTGILARKALRGQASAFYAFLFLLILGAFLMAVTTQHIVALSLAGFTLILAGVSGMSYHGWALVRENEAKILEKLQKRPKGPSKS